MISGPTSLALLGMVPIVGPTCGGYSMFKPILLFRCGRDLNIVLLSCIALASLWRRGTILLVFVVVVDYDRLIMKLLGF